MRDLPTKIDRPQRADAPESAQQLQNFQAQVSQMALFKVFRVTTTGQPQILNAGVRVGTWHVGRPNNFVNVKEISLDGQQITYQAATPGVDIDIIVIF